MSAIPTNNVQITLHSCAKWSSCAPYSRSSNLANVELNVHIYWVRLIFKKSGLAALQFAHVWFRTADRSIQGVTFLTTVPQPLPEEQSIILCQFDVDEWARDSVARFCEFFKSLALFEGLFCVWQSSEPTMAHFYAIGQFVIVVNDRM